MKMEPGLVELPANISFSKYDKGKVSTHCPADVVKMLVRDISRGPLSGAEMHHKDFTIAVSRKEMTRFFDLIETLINRKELQVLLFSNLWKMIYND